MVFINLPATLTEEEELLRQKYARLRRKVTEIKSIGEHSHNADNFAIEAMKVKYEIRNSMKETRGTTAQVVADKLAKYPKEKKQLQALKSVKPEREQTKEKPVKRQNRNVAIICSGNRLPQPRASESAVEAKEQAKKLIMSGAIKLSDKKEKQGFKRSRNLEKKLQDPEKTPVAPVGFQPFSAAHPDEEKDEREDRRGRGPWMRGLYDNFVRGEPGRRPDREDRREERERDRREREPLPKKGNTVYVHGHRVTEELLRKAFSNFGSIVNISMEKERNCGFVTFEKTESSDLAIQEVDGAMIDTVQLRVSMARRQPAFEQTTPDASNSSWASIASNTSQKGSHKDKRNVVEYQDDLF